jgi:hypothetical protein
MTKFTLDLTKPVNHASNAALIRAFNARGFRLTENEAPMVSAPNVNMPLGALNYIRPQAVDALTAVQNADKIAQIVKNGKWADDSVTIKLKEYVGHTIPDDGRAHSGRKTKTNVSTVTRGVYRFRADWDSNDVKEAQWGAMAEDYRASQAEGSMRAIALDRNAFFFRGVDTHGSTLPIYGYLNDVALPAYIPVADGASGEASWADKTPAEIANDVIEGVNQANQTSGGQLERLMGAGQGTLIISIALGSYGRLDRSVDTGNNKTARMILKEMYGDKIEFVSVPEMNSADSDQDVFYVELRVKSAIADTILNSCTELARAYPIEQRSSEVSQKISADTQGCIVQLPLFIARYSGIGASASI